MFNEMQKKAIIHNTGNVRVIAGPGSGKTTVITHRVKYLIEKYKVHPSDILVITFSKIAAKEMQHRFNEISNNRYNVLFCTFHALFFRIISGFYNYRVSDILKNEEIKNIFRGILNNLNIEEEKGEDFIQNIISEISFIKNDLISLNHYTSLYISDNIFKDVVTKYENFKLENKKIDFDDMLIKCYKILKKESSLKKIWQYKYKYILIDEFQDINRVQYECVKILTEHNNNLFVVGDDDQSIYKFRGSQPDILLKFPEDFCNTVDIVLNRNYRSTDEIILLCNKVIMQNKIRYNKDIIGTNKKGLEPKIIYAEDITDEALRISNKIIKISKKTPYEEIAVLYRTHLQSSAFINMFMDMNIPFQLKDELPSIYDHDVSKDICAYFRLALDTKSKDDLIRIINKPKRYINKSIIEEFKKNDKNLLLDMYNERYIKKWQLLKLEELVFYLKSIKKRKTCDAFKYIREAVGYEDYLKEYAKFKKINSRGLIEVLDELQETSKNYDGLQEYLNHIEEVKKELEIKKRTVDKKGVVFSTIHSAKGLEFNTVFIVSVIEGIIPYEKCKTEAEIEEELRLFYVGMTRAKENLNISILRSRHDAKAETTRFLKFIKKE